MKLVLSILIVFSLMLSSCSLFEPKGKDASKVTQTVSKVDSVASAIALGKSMAEKEFLSDFEAMEMNLGAINDARTTNGLVLFTKKDIHQDSLERVRTEALVEIKAVLSKEASVYKIPNDIVTAFYRGYASYLDSVVFSGKMNAIENRDWMADLPGSIRQRLDQTVHVVQDLKGRKLKVMLSELRGTSVEFTRVGDRKMLRVPVDKLSKEDNEFLPHWKRFKDFEIKNRLRSEYVILTDYKARAINVQIEAVNDKKVTFLKKGSSKSMGFAIENLSPLDRQLVKAWKKMKDENLSFDDVEVSSEEEGTTLGADYVWDNLFGGKLK